MIMIVITFCPLLYGNLHVAFVPVVPIYQLPQSTYRYLLSAAHYTAVLYALCTFKLLLFSGSIFFEFYMKFLLPYIV